MTPIAAAVAVALVAIHGGSPGSALAGPTGGQVTAGAATIQQSGTQTVINQATTRAAINWQSFGIAANEAVIFRQPSSSSVALNRVVGSDPSAIYGSLQANGHVFLINPNGILFARGANVDVAGLVASTLGLSNNDFMNGRYVFSGGLGAGSVINDATIRMKNGGYVALLGNQVFNTGTIVANNGTVALGAGESMVLDFHGDGLLSLRVNASAANAKIGHSGEIHAAGGAVIMSAQARNALLDTVLNVDGIVTAKGIVERGGHIYLDGGRSGVTQVSGTLDASSAQGKGGEIRVLGEYVGLFGNAKLNASGATGGGTILVGGDYQGANADIANAFRTYVGRETQIKADAGTQGDGGKVIVWADDATRFSGAISARGGAEAGDGGFAEVSGKNHLDFRGRVDVGAAHGAGGTLLLDPSNITITRVSPTPGEDNSGGAFSSGQFTPTATNALADIDAIEAALNAGALVDIRTNSGAAGNGDIFIDFGQTISRTAGGVSTLRLNAQRNILVSGGVTIQQSAGVDGTDRLNIVFNADSDANGTGRITFAGSAGFPIAFTTRGGDITLGGRDTTLTGPVTLSATGDATNPTGVAITTTTLSSGAGAITIRGTGFGGVGNAKRGILIADGSILQSTAGAITLQGTGGAGGNDNLGVLMGSSTVISASGDIAITGTGGAGTGNNNVGVRLQAGVAGSLVRTNGTGDISITGTGGAASGQNQRGIEIVGGSDVTSTSSAANAGSITLTGIAGAGSDGNAGITVSDAGTTINSSRGDITLTGTGAGTGTSNFGVAILPDSDLSSSGAAAIAITGTGASSAAGITTSSGTAIRATSLGTDILLRSLAGSGMTLAGNVTVTQGTGNSNVTLNAVGGGAVTQAASSAIFGDGLRLLSDGTASFALDTSATNNIETLAGATGGNVGYRDVTNFNVGSVTSSATPGAVASTTSGLSAATIALTGGSISVLSPIASTGTTTFTNSGVLTIGEFTSGTSEVSAAGGFAQNGTGLVVLAGEIATNGGDVSILRAVTLGGDVAIRTDAAANGVKAGDVTFSSTVNASLNLTETLTIDARGIGGDAGGAVTFGNSVGETRKLSALGVAGATVSFATPNNNVDTISATLTQANAALTYSDVDGLTVGTVGGLPVGITTSTAGNVTLTSGGAMDVNARINAGGNVQLANGGTLTVNEFDSVNPEITARNGFSQIGSGGVVLSGDIATDGVSATFVSAVTIPSGQTATIDTDQTANAGAGSVTFSNVVSGAGTLAIDTREAGTGTSGDVTFNATATVGTAGTALGGLGVAARTVTFANDLQNVGTLSVTLSASNAGFTFDNRNALTVGTVGALPAGINTVNGFVTLTTALGALTVDAPITTLAAGSGGGNVTLTSAGAMNINARINASGNVQIDNGATLTVGEFGDAATPEIFARNGLSQTGSGAVSLAGEISTDGASVNFLRSVTVPVNQTATIDTDQTADVAGGGFAGSVTFQNTVLGPGALVVDARETTGGLGTDGTVTFIGPIGDFSTPLAGLGVAARTVSFAFDSGSGQFLSNNVDTLSVTTSAPAAGFTFNDLNALTVGTVGTLPAGITTNEGAVSLSSNFGTLTISQPITTDGPAGDNSNANIALTGGSIIVDAGLRAMGGLTVTNSGTFTLNEFGDAATPEIFARRGVNQDGSGGSNLAGEISTDAGAVTFNGSVTVPVTHTATIDTDQTADGAPGGFAGAVTFQNTVLGPGTLIVDARETTGGLGSGGFVAFNGPIGNFSTPLAGLGVAARQVSFAFDSGSGQFLSNNVDTLSVTTSAPAAGFTFNDLNALTVGTVGTLPAGITTNEGAVSLSSNFGTLTISQPITTDGPAGDNSNANIALTGGSIIVDAGLRAMGGLTVTNTGTFTLNEFGDAATPEIFARRGVNQDGSGGSNLAGEISTDAGAVTFNGSVTVPVTHTATIDTDQTADGASGGFAGAVTFQNTVLGPGTLIVDARETTGGLGSGGFVAFNGPIGNFSTPLAGLGVAARQVSFAFDSGSGQFLSNNVDTLSVTTSAPAAGFTFNDLNALTVGTVGTLPAGITTNEGAVSLSSNFGTLTISQPITTDGPAGDNSNANIALTGGSIIVDAGLRATGGLTVTNTGTFTLNEFGDAATPEIFARRGVNQDGSGGSNLAGEISTDAGAVTFNGSVTVPVTHTATIDTDQTADGASGGFAGAVTFQNTVLGPGTLIVDARETTGGLGSGGFVAFNGPIGNFSTPLAGLGVAARQVSFAFDSGSGQFLSNNVDTLSVTTSAPAAGFTFNDLNALTVGTVGTLPAGITTNEGAVSLSSNFGTLTISQPITTDGPAGDNSNANIALTGGSIIVDAGLRATGGLTVTNTGTFTLNEFGDAATPEIFARRGVNQNGSGSSSLAGEINTDAGAVTFNGSVTVPVTHTATIDTDQTADGAPGSFAGAVTFQNTVRGPGALVVDARETVGGLASDGFVNFNAEIGISGTALAGLGAAARSVGFAAPENNVDTLSVTLSGVGVGFAFTDRGALTVGSVGTLPPGITTNNGPATLTTNIGTLTVSGPIASGSGNVTLTSNNGAITIEAGINVQSLTVSNSGLLTIGEFSGTPVEIFARNGFTQNGAGAVSLGGEITTDGGAVSFLRPVTLTDTVTIRTDQTANATAAGNVTFTGTVISDATPRALVVDARGAGAEAGGAVSFTGGVGQAAPLAALTASGQSIAAGAVRTAGDQSYTAITSTTLNGPLQTDGGSVSFTGPVLLGNASPLTIDTNLTFGGNAGNVTFNGALDGARALVIDATETGAGTSGAVTFSGTVGGVTPLTSLTASGSTISLPSVTTTGAQSYAATTTTLNGNLTTDGGNVTVTGNTAVSGSFRTINTNALNGGTTAGNVQLDGLSGASDSLIIAARGNNNASSDDDGTVTLGATTIGGLLVGAKSLTLGSGSNLVDFGVNLTLSGGAFSYTDPDALGTNIGATNPAFGTISGVSTNNGPISLATANGNLTIASGGVNAGSSTVSLTAGGAGRTLNTAGTIAGAGGVTLTADRIFLQTIVNAGTGAVTLQPFTANRGIDLGSAGNAGTTLELSDTELDFITAGTLRIGSKDGLFGATSSAGDITFSAAISPASVTNLHLLTGANVNSQNFEVTVPGLAASASGDVRLTNSSVSRIAVSAIDAAVFNNTGALEVAAIDGVNGVSAANAILAVVTGNLTQTAPVIVSGYLGVDVIGGSAVLANASNDVALLQIHAPGAVTYRDATGFQITQRSVDVNGLSVSLGSDGSTRASTLFLQAGGAITQDRPVVATSLGLVAGTGVTMTNAGNNVTNLSGLVTGTGNFSYTDTNTFSVVGNTAVNTTATTGISVNNGSLSLTATGVTLASDLFTDNKGAASTVSITGPVTINAATVTIDTNSTAGNTAGNVTFANAVEGQAAGTNTLIVDARSTGTGGAVTFADTVGAATRLAGLAVGGAGVSFTGTNNVDNLAVVLSGAANGVNYVDADALTVSTVGGIVGVTTNSGVVSLTAAGVLTASNGVNTTGSGTTTLTTTSANTNNIVANANIGNAGGATVLTSAGSITGTGTVAGTDVTLDSATGVGADATTRLGTSAATLAARSSTSGGVFVSEADAVTLNTIGVVTNGAAGGGAYDVTAAGTITVAGAVNAGGTGTIHLATTGASTNNILLNTNLGNTGAATVLTSVGNITGAGIVAGTDVTLDSATGVGTDAVTRLGTNATTLAARSTTSGGVFVSEANALTLDTLGGVTNVAAGGAGYDVTAGGTLTVSGPVNTAGAATVLTSTANITGTGTVFGTDVTLDSATGVGTDASTRLNVSTTTLAARSRTFGGVFVSEANAVTLDTIGSVANGAAGGGAFDLTAGGAITVSGAVNTPGTGATTLATSSGDIALGAGVGNASSATTLSAGGAITRSAGTVSGTTVTLNAATGIGSAAPVNTAATTISATNSTSGNIDILEATGVDIAGTTSAGNGSIQLVTTNGSITTSGAISANGAGNVTLRTQGAGSTLTVSNAITSGSGNVILAGQNGVTLNGASADVTTAGPGTYTVDADSNADGIGTYTQGGSGSTVSAPGGVDIRAADIQLSGGTGSIDAGASNVTLRTSTASAAIGVEDSSKSFNLTNGDLNQITTTGTIVIGDATNTGGISIAVTNSISQNPKNFQFTTAGNIGFGNNIFTTTGNVGLTASNGGGTATIGTTGGFLGANTVTALANAGITLNTNATTLSATNNGTSGNISITEQNGVTVTALKHTGTSAGTVSLTSNTGNIALNDGSVVSKGGLVTLSATAGAITDADGGTAVSISNPSGQAALGAATGIGPTEHVDTQVATLLATNSGTAGDIRVSDVDGLIVRRAAQTNTGFSSGGIAIAAGGALTVEAAGSGGLGVTINGTAASSGLITLSANGAASNLSIANAITGKAGAITVTAGSMVIEEGAGTITGGLLTANARAGVILGNSNTVTSFNATTTFGAVSLKNTVPLTVTGINNGDGSIGITNTGSVTTTGPVTAGGPGGIINFAVQGSTTIGAAVTAGRSIFLNSTGASSDAILNGTLGSTTGEIIVAAGRDVTLDAGNVSTAGEVRLIADAGRVRETGTGTITAGLLSTGSAAGTALDNANSVTTFGGGNTTSGNISLTNTGALAVQRILQSGSGTVTLTATGAAGDVSFNEVTATAGGAITVNAGRDIRLNAGSVIGNISGGRSNVTLNAAQAVATGTISQVGSARIDGVTLLTTSSKGGTTVLNENNQVQSFNATNAAGGAISLNTGETLTVTGISQSGGDAVNLTSRGDVNFDGSVTAGSGAITVNAAANVTLNAGSLSTSGNVTLNAGPNLAGAITEAGAGTITAGLLTTSANNGTTLSNNNSVTSFNATNSGNLSFTNTAGTLAVTGLTLGFGDVAVTNTGNLTLGGNVTASFGNLTLTASGAGRQITNNANIASLGNVTFQADQMNLAGGNLGSDAGGTGRIPAVTLRPTSANQPIELGTATDAGRLGLSQAELHTVHADALRIGRNDAGTASGPMTVSSNVTLAQANVNTLHLITGSTIIATAGGINVRGLVLEAASANLDNPANDVLLLAANITQPGQSFTYAGDATEVRTGSLDGVNGITTSNGNVTLGSTGALAIDQPINAGTANLTLNNGSVTQFAAVTAGTLTGTVGTTAILDRNNAITNLGAFTTNGTFTLVDGSGGLTLSGAIDAGTGAVSITTAGGALAAGTNNVSGRGVSLTGTGVTQSPGSAVNAGSGTVLVDGNDGAINLAGSLTTTNGTANAVRIIDATTVALPNITTGSTGTVTIGAAGGNNLSGAVTQNGTTAINTGTLIGNTGSTVALGTANTIANLGAFTSTGNFALNDATGGLTLTGNVAAGAGTVSITTAGGALALQSNNVNGIGGVTLQGVGVTSTGGTISTRAADNSGAASGAIQITATGAGAIDIAGTLASRGADSNTGTASAGGNVTVTTNDGGITVASVVSRGGDGTAGNTSGGNAGTIQYNVGGAGNTLTLNADQTSRGGDAAGTGNAGSGGDFVVVGATHLGADLSVVSRRGTGAGAATAGEARFGNTVDSATATARSLTVTTAGTTTFTGVVGGTHALASLTTDGGGTTVLSAPVTTSGAQTYGDAVTLAGNTTLTGTSGTFGSTIAGAGFDLALDFSGDTAVSGATFSNVRNFSTGNGGTTTLGGTISTLGTQTYNDAVTLGGDTTLTGTTPTFGSTVTGAGFDLTLNFSGTTNVNGGFTGIRNLATGAGGTTVLSGPVETSGTQTYGDAVSLAGDTTLTGTTPTFGSTVTGAGFDLTLNFSDTTNVNGGFAGIRSLATGAGGTTVLSGPVTTSGAQTYGDAVALGGDTTLTGTTPTFGSTLAGAGFDLTLNFSGTTNVNGGFTGVRNLATGAGGTTLLSGPVTTSGTQTYGDAVALGGHTTLTGTTPTFGSTLAGAGFDLTLNFSDTTNVNGAFTGIRNLATGAGGTTVLSGQVTTSGAQTYGDTVTLGGNTTLTGASGTFGSTLAGAGFDLALDFSGDTAVSGATFSNVRNLSTGNGGTTTLSGTVSTLGTQTYGDAVTLGGDTTLTGTTPTFGSTVTGTGFDLTLNFSDTTNVNGGFTGVRNLATGAGGTTVLSGPVTTSGTQSYGDAVTLAADTTLTGTAPTFGSTVAGAGFDLTLNFSGTTNVNGGFTGIRNLATGAGGTTVLSGPVTTSGAQTYGDAVTLGGNTTLTGTTPTFGSTLAGAGFDLTLNFSGTTDVSGAALTGVRNFATGGGGNTRLAGTIQTTGTQTYYDNVLLNGDAVLNTGAADSTFAGTLDGAFGLGIHSTGLTTLGGVVGATTPLASLTTNAGGTTAINTPIVNTSGSQSYGDAVTIGANATLTSSAANITFSSTIDADAAANNRTLTVNAPLGTVTFSGNIGATQALADLDVTASPTTIVFNSAAPQTVNVSAGGGNTVTFNGNVRLDQSLTVNTDGANDNNVVFNGAVNADAAANARTLDVTSGGANVALGAVGNGQELGGLGVSGNQLLLNGDLRGAGSVNFLQLAAVRLGPSILVATDRPGSNTPAGDIVFGPLTTIDSAGTRSTLTLDTRGSRGDGAIDLGVVGPSVDLVIFGPIRTIAGQIPRAPETGRFNGSEALRIVNDTLPREVDAPAVGESLRAEIDAAAASPSECEATTPASLSCGR